MNRRSAVSGAVLLLLGALSSTARDTTIAEGARYPEGAYWVGERLYYAEMTGGRIAVWDGRSVAAFWDAPRLFGLSGLFSRSRCGPTAIAPRGNRGWFVACHYAGMIALLSPEGSLEGFIETDETGRRLTNPNDLTPDGAGGLYASDSGLFQSGAPPEGRILHVDGRGRIRTVARGLAYANGVHFDPRSRSLFVSEHLGRRILRYPMREDGALDEGAVFADIAALRLPDKTGFPLSGPDGLERSPGGDLVVAESGQGRLLRFDGEGRLLGVTDVPTPFVTSVSFAPDGMMAVTGTYDLRAPERPGRVWLVPPF